MSATILKTMFVDIVENHCFFFCFIIMSYFVLAYYIVRDKITIIYIYPHKIVEIRKKNAASQSLLLPELSFLLTTKCPFFLDVQLDHFFIKG